MRNKYGGYNNVPGSRKRKGSEGYNELLDNLYQTWYDMLKRCSDEYQAKDSNYLGTTCNSSWYYFSEFLKDVKHIDRYAEYERDSGRGWFLDKDIKINGNKHYSVANCMFITREENGAEVALRCKSKRVLVSKGSYNKVYNSCVEASKAIGCSHATISEYARYGYVFKGYKFEYLD